VYCVLSTEQMQKTLLTIMMMTMVDEGE